VLPHERRVVRQLALHVLRAQEQVMTSLATLLSMCLVAMNATISTPPDQIVLKNGNKVSGEVVTSNDDDLTLRFVASGQDATMTLQRDQVDPHSWYVVRSRALPDTATEHLRLARFCSENGMFFQAERELNRVLELDDSMAAEVDVELMRARDGAAAKVVELATAALAKDDVVRAESLVATVITRYDDTTQADVARALVERVAARKLELERDREAERAKKAQAAEEARRVAWLEPVGKKLESARRKNVDALKDKNLSRAQNGFAASVHTYEQTAAELDRLARAQENDDELRSRIDALRGVVMQEAIEVHVSLGSTYLVRGSFTRALAHANEALAMDTRSQYAKEFRARVEIASAEASRRRFAGRTTLQ
jgi:tetratricopeptide (TPR) repeat protein